MVHPADDALRKAVEAIPEKERVIANTKQVYGKHCTLVDIPYEKVMAMAAEMMRKAPIGRAAAVEMAYDNRLWDSSNRKYERTGEVVLLKKLGCVRALCVEREGGLSASKT